MKDFKILNNIFRKEDSYRIQQAYNFIFKDLEDNWENATNLPKHLRTELSKNFPLEIDFRIYSSGKDNTAKALIKLEDGLKVETVLIPHRDRNTICASSQVGCPLGCKFCATGEMGFKRNLSQHEIVSQILLFARYLKKENIKISNIVFMGMGEPLLNYDNVLSSLKFINRKDTFNIGARNISISTVGIIEGIRKLADEKIQVNLAVSLHAPNDKLRNKLVPINRKYPIEKLFKAVDTYIQKTNRKVMIEYILINGINDSIEKAKELSKLLRGKLVMVNLIPCNRFKNFVPSTRKRIVEFKKELETTNTEVALRQSYGQDIHAACGQLAYNK